jgi:hypothetical protein
MRTFQVGQQVQFAASQEILFGTDRPVLITATVIGDPIAACSRTAFVPVKFDSEVGEARLYIQADQIL